MPYVGEQLRPNVIFFMRFKVEPDFENRSELWGRRWDVVEEVESFGEAFEISGNTLFHFFSACTMSLLKPQSCPSKKQ